MTAIHLFATTVISLLKLCFTAFSAYNYISLGSQSVEWTPQRDQTGDPLSQLQTGTTPPSSLPRQTGTPLHHLTSFLHQVR